MVNEAEKKKATERELMIEEEKKQKAKLAAHEKKEAERLAEENKAIEAEKSAAAKAREAEEAKHSLKVVDVGTFIGRISPDECMGVDRRLAGIRLMFEELGADNYVTTVTYKGTEAFVFKKVKKGKA